MLERYLAIAILAASPVLSGNLKIGAWVGSASDTSLDGKWPQPTQANVQAFVELQGRGIEYLQHYIIWPATWGSAKKYADVAAANGATLFATWQPNGYTAPDIVAGKADAYIGKFAKDVGAYPREVWLRPLHEANGGDWYTWAVGNSSMANTDENVAEAFRHIVKIFRDSGATNVKWVWTTNAENAAGGNPTSFDGTYPGDDWADYISIDGYNFGLFHTVANSGWASSWKSFSQVFKPAYKVVSKIDKPIFVAEFSSSELGGNKAKWYRDAFDSLAISFPKIFALVVFSNNDANGDWRINTTEASLQAWKECVATYASTATSIDHRTPATDRFARLAGGALHIDLDRAADVDLRIVSGTGSTVAHRRLGRLEPGKAALPLGRVPPGSIVLVRAGTAQATLLSL